jgi:hypothetical protein
MDGLVSAMTPYFLIVELKDVDARHKAGHDGGGVARRRSFEARRYAASTQDEGDLGLLVSFADGGLLGSSRSASGALCRVSRKKRPERSSRVPWTAL